MKIQPANILVIDDDPDVLIAARLLLKRHYRQVLTESDPEQIPAHLSNCQWNIVLLDMNFETGANSGREGLKWLSTIQSLQPSALVILMTAYGAVDTAVNAIKQGAVDFILKPWQNERLLTTVEATMRLHESRQEVQHLKSRERELQPAMDSVRMVGNSPQMATLQTSIQRVAPTDANVLITGENGTGKEVVAREIYRLSARCQEILVSVDLGSVTETLFESELFGHKKGAFTGARADRIGRFQAASGGTLFLDEIGNLPLHLQGKLLSVLEQREVTPVGSNLPVSIDVRLVCATNMPLQDMVREGTFREDLLYRINTVELQVPALREHADDIPLLLEHFMEIYCRKYNLSRPRVTREVLTKLAAYHWPGNIRELRHIIERALIMGASGTLKPEDLLLSENTPSRTGTEPNDGDSLNLEEMEKATIERALRKFAGNISHAAKALGITRTSLYRRMEKYGL